MKLTEHAALTERLLEHEQVPATESLSDLPPYVESFLAHLRLLVGVPFAYLVPDARLLPDESIRFFYLDRSWTDRLIDGAVAVGKVGTRELAHVQAHAESVQRSVDVAESLVRGLQRGKITDYVEARKDQGDVASPAEVITGVLLRSALVSGWPHLELRALRDGARLTTLRLERLSPGVMIALFRGVPDRVELEEPHHGVQFGVKQADDGSNYVTIRDAQGVQIKTAQPGSSEPVAVRVPVPMRPGNRGVVDVTALRRAVHQKVTSPAGIAQTGSAAFALTALAPPYQQPFGKGEGSASTGFSVAHRVQDVALTAALLAYVKGGG